MGSKTAEAKSTHLRKWKFLLLLALVAAWWIKVQSLPMLALQERLLAGLSYLYSLLLVGAAVFFFAQGRRLRSYAAGEIQETAVGWRFILEEPSRAPRPASLSGGEMLVGRDEQARLRPDDPRVSRRHCRIFVKGGRLFVQDLGSANGTWLQGRRLGRDPAALTLGDVLFLGGPQSGCRITIAERSNR
ncbi:MAG: FHA domain-containing protein [Thermodesulfobacteriota bacterium]